MNRDENQLLLHDNSICVTNDEVEKRDLGERKKVINSLDFLTAPSNRRLTDQSLTLFSLNWSIDRITIVGFLKKFNFDSTILHLIFLLRLESHIYQFALVLHQAR